MDLLGRTRVEIQTKVPENKNHGNIDVKQKIIEYLTMSEGRTFYERAGSPISFSSERNLIGGELLGEQLPICGSSTPVWN